MKRATLLIAVILGCLAIGVAYGYPDKPIRLIIPFPPGGSSDVIGREIAAHVASILGQQILVDNRGGANGLIGTEILANSAPDGYTMMFHILTSHITNPWVYKNIRYDVLRDFSSVTIIGSSGLVVVAHPSFPVLNIQDLVLLARAKPGAISIGSFGRASMAHLSIQLLMNMANVAMIHVPYRGSGPAVIDTLGGQIPVSVVALPAALAYIKQGRLRALAVTIPRRSKQLPNVPAIAETPGLETYNLGLMYGMLAPANTPKSMIDRVQNAVRMALESPAVRARLYERGLDKIIASTPTKMDDYIVAEYERLGQLVKSAGITPE